MKRKVTAFALTGLLSLTFATSSAFAANQSFATSFDTSGNTQQIDGQNKYGRATLTITSGTYSGDKAVGRVMEFCAGAQVQIGTITAYNTAGKREATDNFWMKSGCYYNLETIHSPSNSGTVKGTLLIQNWPEK